MNNWVGMSEEQVGIIQKARKRVIESIGKNMDLYGVTLSSGHLYGMMFFQDKPMTLDEMGEGMGMSKTSMSTGVRTLTDLKMVHKVWEPGTRKDLYEVEPDWYQTFADYFAIKWRKQTEMNLQAVRKSLSELQRLKEAHQDIEELHKIVNTDIEKLQEAIRYYMWLGRLIDSFENGDIFSLVPKEETDKP
ncbi:MULTISPECIES: GbsR/MarR family transcriptional regulator [unclassified Paenibacillus]|uniref:GbsR/MarR family transcriptional regulator n=1 Tax=unclassified Paenibacillus TaxID=185978 RepID=UPI001AE3CB49|nr:MULTISPECIES: GbsR/MarR family transcriptional regulator [unclassified Paenibacillus]MBP1156726.1 DNA-binding transcriptional regulator GbsR (MarR family) [Paenibacillus sp. PvP091]MBP1172536.1 DNA-binding transcriptional regulator GbsR (MarR family) [Paenibacillus sp. PvR098]MBP2438916.1 DNA-binding transcriptional regulator GbsR (MarR family) [Paenibacillus sp. PvP052]